MRKGKALERLVEALEKQLNQSDNISIESPKYLIDRTNSQKREHDVLISIKNGHHALTISIECKDRKKPVGVPDVEAFSTKCLHTNVNQGVFVSTSGFTKSALKSAKHLGIKCLTFEELAQLDWLTQDAKVIIHSNNFKTAALKYVVSEPPSYPLEEYNLFTPDHELITNEIIKNNLRERSNQLPRNKVGELLEYPLLFQLNGFYLKHKNQIERINVTALEILVSYVYEVSESLFDHKLYKDESLSTGIAELAIASVNLNDQPQQLTIIDDGKSRSMQIINLDE